MTVICHKLLFFIYNKRINERERIPIKTITNKLFERIAAKSVGTEAKAFSRLICGRCPIFWVNRLLNHKADIMTIGTKLKYSSNGCGKSNFFSKTNGRTLESQVARVQPKIVSNVNSKEGMFDPHPQSAPDQCYNYDH